MRQRGVDALCPNRTPVRTYVPYIGGFSDQNLCRTESPATRPPVRRPPSTETPMPHCDPAPRHGPTSISPADTFRVPQWGESLATALRDSPAHAAALLSPTPV